jgi:N-dimethylarginine dimethylaminohydrolase
MIYRSKHELDHFKLSQIKSSPYPQAVLMCPPDFFDIVDVKNPFMAAQIGKVDHPASVQQWRSLKTCFESIGLEVKTIEPELGREDMVFCANQTFVGLNAHGGRVCVLSHMKHASRQKEVAAFSRWFQKENYQVLQIENSEIGFEGGGDALWHPGRHLIWGGVGPRTQREIYPHLSEVFGADVIEVELVNENFYHLDTCLALLDETTALVCREAFSEASFKVIQKIIPRLVVVSAEDTSQTMVCNAAGFFGKHVVLHPTSSAIYEQLNRLGFRVHPTNTGEFIKSGGSVFCLKMSLV